MAQWQPEIANSLQYILDYEGGEQLVDIAGHFTVDEKQFGEVKEIELKPDGKTVPVTLANREEFVRLRIAYEFKVQCAQQIAAFKKGFERLIDKEVLHETLSPYDLELLICGQRTLDFKELKQFCIYANGFTP